MSKKRRTTGKYERNTPRKRSIGGILVVVLLLLAVCMAVLLYFAKRPDRSSTATAAPSADQTTAPAQTVSEQKDMPQNSVNLGYGVYVKDIAGYTGLYMEDGSDEVLSNILMMVVENGGDQDIQYAKINMDLGDQQAEFIITTLPVGESIILLEQNRMAWNKDTDYAAILPRVENIAYFQEPTALHEDKLEIQIADGALNVTNISGADISGTIRVFYKNAVEDLLYGGITYQVTIEGGLKAEEIRQVMTKHASDTGSRIMFVTITQ